MFDVLRQFARQPGLMLRTVTGPELFIAGVAAFAVSSLPAALLPDDQVRLVDVAKQVFTYSSIGFSACMGGITMLVRVSDTRFLEALAAGRAAGDKTSKVNHLPMALTSIAWTAFCHWVSLILCLLLVMLTDPQRPLITSAVAGGRIVPAVVLFLFTYNVIQFLATVLLIAAMGLRFAEHQRERMGSQS